MLAFGVIYNDQWFSMQVGAHRITHEASQESDLMGLEWGLTTGRGSEAPQVLLMCSWC